MIGEKKTRGGQWGAVVVRDRETVCCFTKEGQSRSRSRRPLIRRRWGWGRTFQAEGSTKALKQELSLCIKEEQSQCGLSRVRTGEKYRDEVKRVWGDDLIQELVRSCKDFGFCSRKSEDFEHRCDVV